MDELSATATACRPTGATATHPIARAPRTNYRRNPFYDAGIATGFAADRTAVSSRLDQIER